MYSRDTFPDIVIRNNSYKYIDEYIQHLVTWDLEIAQLDSGPYESCELFISTGTYEFNFFRHSRQLLVRSYHAAPGFQFGFSLFDELSARSMELRHQDRRPGIYCQPSGVEARVLSPPNYEGATLFISYERYQQLLDAYFDSPVDFPSRSDPSMFVPSAEQYQSLSACLSRIGHTFCERGAGEPVTFEERAWVSSQIDNTIIPLLLQVVANRTGKLVQRRPQRFYNGMTLILDNLDAPPGIDDLARELGTSARNVQYLFQTHLGMSPKHFTKLCRINVARSRLWSASYKRGAITDIAGGLGYSHMGEFSREFRRIFQITPRELVRRYVRVDAE